MYDVVNLHQQEFYCSRAHITGSREQFNMFGRQQQVIINISHMDMTCIEWW